MEKEAQHTEKKVWICPILEILEVKHTYTTEEWEFIESAEGFWKRQLMES
ncbi:hypothetical protein ACFPYJ_09870 [Paenibacillus solisilvae]|uniref:Uncharacterized protein n=1 Tax=Paenibacillus solisilvae TaxID=2486751 RepID=A0ABW0VXD2_9BACL